MPSLDDIFKKEFNQTRNSLGVRGSVFDLGLKQKQIPHKGAYTVEGIEVEYYKKLNGYNVVPLPKGVPLERRLINSQGEFRTNARDEVMKQGVSVPKGSLPVLSTLPLGLPYNHQEQGYDYVDYIELDGSRKYIYILPRSVLYKVNFTALAVSSRRMQAYSALSVKTWGYGILNVCIIPYKPGREYTNTVVLYVKTGLNYDKEIQEVFNYFYSQGIISDPSDYVLSDGTNIGFQELPPSYDPVSYLPSDLTPLSNLAENELEELLAQ